MNRVWTSRERVQAALSHQEPDRVPVGLEIAFAPYQKLRQYLGFPPCENNALGEAEPVQLDAEVANFLGLDLTGVRLRSFDSYPFQPGETYLDEWQIGRRMRADGGGRLELEVIAPPLQTARLEDLRDFPWPDPNHPNRIRGLEAEARALFQRTNLALAGRFGGSILETACDLRGAAQWKQDLADNPDFACALLNRIAGVEIGLDEAGLRCTGPYLSVMEIHEASLTRPECWDFSPVVWRYTIRPVLERRWRAARQVMNRYAPQAKLLLHAPIPHLDLFADLVEGEIDAFGPLQPGQDFANLKHSYGDRLSFWGGIDSDLLETGSENEVRDGVKDSLQQLGEHGGYILAPSQMVQAAAKPQNIVAMCETVKMYGRYPTQ